MTRSSFCVSLPRGVQLIVERSTVSASYLHASQYRAGPASGKRRLSDSQTISNETWLQK